MKICNLVTILLAAAAQAQSSGCRRKSICVTSGSLDHPQACRPSRDFCNDVPGICGVGQRCQRVNYCDGCVASGGCRTCYIDCCVKGA